MTEAPHIPIILTLEQLKSKFCGDWQPATHNQKYGFYFYIPKNGITKIRYYPYGNRLSFGAKQEMKFWIMSENYAHFVEEDEFAKFHKAHFKLANFK